MTILIMKKNLSKTLAMLVFITNAGIMTTPTFANTLNSEPKIVSGENKQELKVPVKPMNATTKVIKDEEKPEDQWNSELLIGFASNDESKEREFYDNVTSVKVNGAEYTKSYLNTNKTYIASKFYGGIEVRSNEFKDDINIIEIKATSYYDMIIEVKKDGTELAYKLINPNTSEIINPEDIKDKDNKKLDDKDSNNNPSTEIGKQEEKKDNEALGEKPQGEESKEIKGNLNDLADGIYTINFKAFKEENPSEESMLGGFFDNNVKLEVKGGKKTLTFLNTVMSSMIYDFRLDNNGEFKESKSENIGSINASGEYKYKSFTVEAGDLAVPNTVGVLVSAMGGQKNDIGNIEKYKKAILQFESSYKEGWNGFKTINNEVSESEKLNSALIKAGLDIDKNGQVTPEEVSKYSKDTLNLSGKELTDISLLKHLNSNVKELYLAANRIKELPEGIFDNLVNLEKLSLSSNLIEELPEGIFDKLTKLEELQLGRVKLKSLDANVFKNLKNLKSIGLVENKGLEELPDDIFSGLDSLEGIYMYEGSLKKIPSSVFTLTNLRSLHLNNNNLEIIPDEFDKLPNLRGISLNNNIIKELPKSIYNLKDLTTLALENNELTSVPNNIKELFPNLYGIDLTLNKLKNANDITGQVKVTPQKNSMNLSLKAENQKILLDYDLSALDIMAWSYYGDEDVKTVEDYKNWVKDKDVVDFLNEKDNDWKIVTEIQKKNKDGNYKTIDTVTILDKADEPLNYVDKTMKNGDEYRVIKTLTRTGGLELVVFTDVQEAVAKADEIKVDNDNQYKDGVYEVKNSIEDTSETGKAMVRRVLKDTTNMDVRDGKNYLTLEVNPQGMLDNYRILVDDSEVNYEKETLDNGMLKLKFEIPSLDAKVSMKLYVIPMARDVEFTVAHDKESVKLISANKENEDNKPSADNNSTKPNTTNPSTTKSSEDKTSNNELNVTEHNNKVNEKLEDAVVKGKLYTVQNEVSHEREVGREMARKYLEKTSKIEEIDGKMYATITFNNSQFMKEFKIDVNGEDVNYEIVERNGDLLSLRFEIPNIDSDVKVKMFVIPMNSNVEFGVKFLKNTLNLVKEYEVKKSELKQGGKLPYTGGLASGGLVTTLGSMLLGVGAFMSRRKRK